MIPVIGGGDPGGVGRRASPNRWAAIAMLAARTADDEPPELWATTGVPHCLADLEVPVETVWAANQLALSGADHTILVETLGITDDTARRIIVATTERLLARDTRKSRLPRPHRYPP